MTDLLVNTMPSTPVPRSLLQKRQQIVTVTRRNEVLEIEDDDCDDDEVQC